MSTFEIRGQKLRSKSNRRFLVVVCRPDDFAGRRWDGAVNDYVPETYRAFGPVTIRRSDSLETARAAGRKYGFVAGGWNVVFDTVTEEEIA